MSRRKPNRGRTTPKKTRPSNWSNTPTRPQQQQPHQDEPSLVPLIRKAMDEHPMGLLGLASTLIVEIIEPGSLDRKGPGIPPSQGIEELATEMAFSNQPETNALCLVLLALSLDEKMSARVRATMGDLSGVPDWVQNLDSARAVQPWEMSHVLRDGDNAFVGVDLGNDLEATIVAYVDHNMGTLVKDVITVPDSVQSVLGEYTKRVDDPETSFQALDRADTRARLQEAIVTSAELPPSNHTEEWPRARPLLEWMISKLPSGGTKFTVEEDHQARALTLADQFTSSSDAADLSVPQLDYADTLVTYKAATGNQDPLLWSPVSVEVALSHMFILNADNFDRHYRQLPDALRALIPWCHRKASVPAYLTSETLLSIDMFEDEFLDGIESLIEADGPPWDADEHGDLYGPEGDLSFEEYMLGNLANKVGGLDALAKLDSNPLPDEMPDRTTIAEDIVPRIERTMELCDQACNTLFDVEIRTACRRLLIRIAEADPEIFRRRARDETAASAIVWTIASANESFAWHGVYVADLAAHFGIKGSANSRAGTLLKAIGIQRWYGAVELESPDFLCARYRQYLITAAERYQ